MPVVKQQVLPICREEDVVYVRQEVRRWAEALRLSLVDQTKLVTAASELARNTLVHGDGGEVRMESLQDGLRVGIRLHFSDFGRGIANIELAMRDGYTTGKGMGLGLGGAKRLVNEFEIESSPGHGTRVSITRWK